MQTHSLVMLGLTLAAVVVVCAVYARAMRSVSLHAQKAGVLLPLAKTAATWISSVAEAREGSKGEEEKREGDGNDEKEKSKPRKLCASALKQTWDALEDSQFRSIWFAVFDAGTGDVFADGSAPCSGHGKLPVPPTESQKRVFEAASASEAPSFSLLLPCPLADQGVKERVVAVAKVSISRDAEGKEERELLVTAQACA